MHTHIRTEEDGETPVPSRVKGGGGGGDGGVATRCATKMRQNIYAPVLTAASLCLYFGPAKRSRQGGVALMRQFLLNHQYFWSESKLPLDAWGLSAKPLSSDGPSSPYPHRFKTALKAWEKVYILWRAWSISWDEWPQDNWRDARTTTDENKRKIIQYTECAKIFARRALGHVR